MNGAAFHPCGAGNDLRAGRGGDGDTGGLRHRGAGTAGHADDLSPHAFGVGHGPQHIGRPAGGRDAHQHILGAETDLPQVLLTQGGVVLRTLHRAEHGVIASGDKTYHHVRVCGVRGRTLHRIQHAQPSGGAAAAVDQPPARLQLRRDNVHGGGNMLRLFLNSQGGLFILVVDEADHIDRRKCVDIIGPLVAFLGFDLIPVHLYPPCAGAAAPGRSWAAAPVDTIIVPCQHIFVNHGRSG